MGSCAVFGVGKISSAHCILDVTLAKKEGVQRMLKPGFL